MLISSPLAFLCGDALFGGQGCTPPPLLDRRLLWRPLCSDGLTVVNRILSSYLCPTVMKLAKKSIYHSMPQPWNRSATVGIVILSGELEVGGINSLAICSISIAFHAPHRGSHELCGRRDSESCRLITAVRPVVTVAVATGSEGKWVKDTVTIRETPEEHVLNVNVHSPKTLAIKRHLACFTWLGLLSTILHRLRSKSNL